MTISRRVFVKRLVAGGVAAASVHPLMAALDWPALKSGKTITILHTNDVHSQIDPLPANHARFPNMGGFARRASLINKIRSENPNLLLLDCGDIFQGTPYFNFYKGKLEISLMNQMGYQASAIGNHEFDNGIDILAQRMGEAKFPFLAANYQVDNTPLAQLVKPYHIFTVGDFRVGVIGVGIELNGLVDPTNFGSMKYIDPISVVNDYARTLKSEHGCHLVVVLSHLGYSYSDNKVSDMLLAQSSADVDLILGGHTHTFLDNPTVVKNTRGRDVYVNQAGWAGVRLGRIDIDIEMDGQSPSTASIRSQNYTIG